jgi:hypothetical protein
MKRRASKYQKGFFFLLHPAAAALKYANDVTTRWLTYLFIYFFFYSSSTGFRLHTHEMSFLSLPF